MIIGFTCGAFDLLHAGHVIMFEECKKNCDYLMVGLHINPSTERKEKNKPIQTVYERFLQLSACKWVDKIIPYESENDLNNIFAIETIDIRFVGEEYLGLKLTGETMCSDKGIEIIHTSRKHDFSSKNLRKRISL